MRPLVKAVVEGVVVRFVTKAETDDFLQARNAHVTLQNADGKSFYGLPLRSTTEINSYGHHLLLEIKRFDHETMHVVVCDRKSNKTLLDAAVNITDGVESLAVNIENLQLMIELDASPESATT